MVLNLACWSRAFDALKNGTQQDLPSDGSCEVHPRVSFVVVVLVDIERVGGDLHLGENLLCLKFQGSQVLLIRAY